MASNLSASNATYNTSGKFGSSMSAGFARSAGNSSEVITTPAAFTIRGWVKRTGSGSNLVFMGSANGFYLSMQGGKASANISNSPGTVVITGTTDIFGGGWHFIEFSVGPAGMLLFVNGNLEAQNVGPYGGPLNQPFVLNALTSTGGFPWGGEIDDFAVFSGQMNTTSYAPPTAATSPQAANLLALYSLDGDVADSAGASATATALTLAVNPAATAVGVAATITVGTNQPLTGSQTQNVTFASTVPGTFSPASVTLSSTTPTATVSFTPNSAASGTITGTATGTPTITSGTAAFTATASVNNVLVNGTANAYFSPGNWVVGASSAKTNNTGAYFRARITGASCTLQFDLTGVSTPLPILEYQIDGSGPWITAPVAANVALTMPSNTTEWGAKGGHLIEVVIKGTTQGASRWGTTAPTSPAVLVNLTGIILDASATMSLPPVSPLVGWYFGDSITETTRTLNLGGANDAGQCDARMGWAALSARALNAEFGIIGFGGQGWVVAGAGSVPALGSAFNFQYAGQPRSFSSPPNYIVVNMGTNDSADVTSAVTAFLNALVPLIPSTTKVIILRPFNGSHASQITAGIAASTAPSRVNYVNTAGWFNTANSGDGLHPYGIENLTSIGPKATAAIKSLLDGAAQPTLTARTVSVALTSGRDASGNAVPAANLANLRVSFHDEPSPDVTTVPRFQTAGETTDAAGVLTFVVNSTLSAGGTGHLTVLGASNLHFNGPVQVT
jgi:hypothetical protein